MSSFFMDDSIEHAILSPRTIHINETLESAIKLMGDKKVWDLPVLDNGILKGLLHLHPLVDALMKVK